MAGSHEVRGSIPLGSTIDFSHLRVAFLLPRRSSVVMGSNPEDSTAQWAVEGRARQRRAQTSVSQTRKRQDPLGSTIGKLDEPFFKGSSFYMSRTSSINNEGPKASLSPLAQSIFSEFPLNSACLVQLRHNKAPTKSFRARYEERRNLRAAL